jgi:lipopolysaccharide export system protein LptA
MTRHWHHAAWGDVGTTANTGASAGADTKAGTTATSLASSAPPRHEWGSGAGVLRALRACVLPVLALASVASVWAASAQANPRSAQADRLQPVQILSDESRYEEARQLTTLRGNVTLTQGSMVIRAGELQLKQGPAGRFNAVALGQGDQPARFRQNRGGPDETLEAQADRIEFDSQTQVLRLVQRASIRRLVGSRVREETSGQEITFNGESETFSVTGGSASASPSNPGGRVRIVITPRNEGAASAPEAAASGALLKPATSLPAASGKGKTP